MFNVLFRSKRQIDLERSTGKIASIFLKKFEYDIVYTL